MTERGPGAGAGLKTCHRSNPVFDILLVFSPALALVVIYKLLGVTDRLVLICATWVTYVFMLAMIHLNLRARGQIWSDIGLTLAPFTARDIVRTVLKSIAVFIFALAGFLLGSIIMANIVGIPEPADMTRYNYLRGNLPMLILSLVGVYFVSSFGEEVIYRGFLISRFRELFGDRARTEGGPNDTNSRSGRAPLVAALAASSLIFGLVHFEWGAMGMVQTTFMGGALGLSFILNKFRLWPLILAHCYLDTILLVQMYLAE